METTCQFNLVGLGWDLEPDPGGMEEGSQEEWGQFSSEHLGDQIFLSLAGQLHPSKSWNINPVQKGTVFFYKQAYS